MEKRKERIDDLGRRLEEIVATKDAAARRILIKALVETEAADHAEFAACVRAYVRDKERDGAIPVA